MKKILLLLLALLLLLLTSCDKANAEIDALKAEIDSLKKQVEEAKLQDKANELLEKAKKEIEELKAQLNETKEKLEKAVKEQKEKLTGTAEETPVDTGKAKDPVTADKAMEILEPLSIHLERKDTPEFQGVLGNKRGPTGDLYFLFYAVANTETKSLELFNEKIHEEGDFTKLKDEDDDKVYTLERDGEALLAVLNDKVFFFGKAQSLDKLKSIALSLGLDLD